MMKAAYTIVFILLAYTFETRADTLLVFRKGSENFDVVRNAFAAEVEEEHKVEDFIFDEDLSYDRFKQEILKVKPKLLILMDNLPLNYAKKLVMEDDPYLSQLQGVATMGLNLHTALKGNSRIAGISYEAPGFSVINGFRYLVKEKVKKVAVIYRKSQHKDIIAQAERQLKRTGIELTAFDSEKKGKGKVRINSFIRKNLKKTSENFDAVWVLADNVLMNSKAFNKYWIPQSDRIPFICPLEKFVQNSMSFCVYAAFPSHADLGLQLAEMVFTILEGSRSISEIGVQDIVSVKRAINSAKFDKFKLEADPKALSELVIVRE